jgi:NitT/TauT family transport system substrate-binding protein
MSRDAEGRTVVDVTLADSVAEYSKYSGWPELKESFMAGQVRAAYLLAPMVMDLVDSGVAAKIVSLGHRSGAVIMVRADSPVKTFRDLRGRRIAIPSCFAVDHLFVRRMLRPTT